MDKKEQIEEEKQDIPLENKEDEEDKYEGPSLNYSYVEMSPNRTRKTSSPTIERIKNIQNLGQ